MQEVTIRIRFIKECIGYVKTRLPNSQEVIYRMPRDGSDRVIFMPTWWRAGMTYASKVLNRASKEVTKIDWSPVVDGRLTQWRRVVARDGKRSRYALHESFRPREIIGINAVLPDGLSIDTFHQLLEVFGTYRGISPFKSENEAYGTFEVVSVMPTIRSPQSKKEESKT